MKKIKYFESFIQENFKKLSREQIDNLLIDGGIEIKYDYTWSREDNLNFHQNKNKAKKAITILSKNGVRTGPINYLFGDNYIKIYNIES